MDTSGKASIRIDKACEPLTPAIIQRLLDRTGEADFTAGMIDGAIGDLISSAAMEYLRSHAVADGAAADLLSQSDEELLHSLGPVRNGIRRAHEDGGSTAAEITQQTATRSVNWRNGVCCKAPAGSGA